MRLRASAVSAIAPVIARAGRPQRLRRYDQRGWRLPQLQSVDDLYRAATLVVRARIDGPPESRKIEALDYTVFQARVEKVYPGTPGADAVEIKQLAGREDDGPDLAPGTTYVLFLETYANVPASLLNPTQAQYTVDSSGQLLAAGDNALKVTLADLDRLSGGRIGDH